MKKIMIGLIAAFSLFSNDPARAQADEIAQLLLNVEKLAQFKQILTDLEKGYQILNKGYRTIKDLSEGNFNLHRVFLDGLMEVSPAVRNYHKVAEIVEYQIRLVKEYKTAQSRFFASGLLHAGEMDHIGRVYENLLEGSLRHLDELVLVITANKLRMSDDERLKMIDRIHAEMADKLQFLRSFNGSTSVVVAQRERQQQDLETMKNVHGINE